jgi:TRAP-type transport system small permease protein
VTKLIDSFFKLLEFLIVASLAAMVVMVFGNVVLRYAFNSGILISEEMSRYCFMWLTFIGAMVALREGGHLGVDTLIKRLPLLGKKVCAFLSECLMLMCCVFFFMGTWTMHPLHVTNVSPVVGMSMIWVYGVGYVVSVVMGLIILHKIYRLVTGQLSEDELVMVVEAEGLKEAQAHVAGNVERAR